MSEYSPHEVVWNRERSARFWASYSLLPSAANSYFSSRVGGSLISMLVRKGIPLRGRILDFGCGPGYLLEELLERGVACEGLDFSREAVERANARLSRYSHYRGARVVEGDSADLPLGEIDLVFLVETIEHLLPEDLDVTLGQVSGLLKAGGLMVVTTPNDEDLDQKKVLCPECGGIFHPMQHVQSWTREKLSELMVKTSFETILAESVFLSRPTWRSRGRALLGQILGEKPPHLVYVGRKVGTPATDPTGNREPPL